jgi:CelD/BcsL family acetyltransferase involved in cellulose biosynthesis
MVSEANHAVVLPQHSVIDLFEDDWIRDLFDALHRAVLLPTAERVLGPLLSGHYD